MTRGTAHADRTLGRVDGLGVEAPQDEITICKCRHLLERKTLGKPLLDQVQRNLQENVFKISRGMIVDATIIGAPSSARNQQQQREPKMHQARKRKRWYFRMQAHAGGDSRTRLNHSLEATAPTVADCRVLPELLHGHETRALGDQAYPGQGT